MPSIRVPAMYMTIVDIGEMGNMISVAKTYIREYPHMTIFPGAAIMITILSLNLMGDGLRDALDPHLKS